MLYKQKSERKQKWQKCHQARAWYEKCLRQISKSEGGQAKACEHKKRELGWGHAFGVGAFEEIL